MRSGALGNRGARRIQERCDFSRLHLVCLGEHQLIGHGCGIERVHDILVIRLQPMTAIDQEYDALQRRAPAQVIADQRRPAANLILRRFRVAVARHVHEAKRVANAEEVELTRAARLSRSARQFVAPSQCIDQRRLADIRASRERDLRHASVRQKFHARHAALKVDGPRKEQAAAFDAFFVFFRSHFTPSSRASIARPGTQGPTRSLYDPLDPGSRCACPG